jgi:elongation factor 1-beta
MARVIIDFKVMPESVEIDLEKIKEILKSNIEEFEGNIIGDMSEEPVAFGLKSVMVKFSYDEKKGSTDDLEDKISSEEGIQSVEVVGVSRAMG